MFVELFYGHVLTGTKDANTSTKSGQALPHPIVVTVDDPQKVGDPIRPYILYTVHTEVRLWWHKKLKSNAQANHSLIHK